MENFARGLFAVCCEQIGFPVLWVYLHMQPGARPIRCELNESLASDYDSEIPVGFKLYTQRLWVTNSSFETETETHGVNEILEIAAPAVSEI